MTDSDWLRPVSMSLNLKWQLMVYIRYLNVLKLKFAIYFKGGETSLKNVMYGWLLSSGEEKFRSVLAVLFWVGN